MKKCIYEKPISIIHWNYPGKKIPYNNLQAPIAKVTSKLKELKLI